MVEVKVKVILKVIDEVRAKVISSKCGKMGVVLSLFASTTINVCILYKCNWYSNKYKKEEFLPPKKNIKKK